MCGIAGWLNGARDAPTLLAMLDALHHRGPESNGVYDGAGAHLGHARLSIVDVEGGRQPLTNEDETVWVIANGEIFNHVELRERLIARGHRFRTGSDCEVLVHLYEEWGPESFARLNGQYAFALYDGRRQRLVLCRDRVGICPLFYSFVGDTLYFASEVKALLRVPGIDAAADLPALGAIWTYWTLPLGRTAFRGIHEFLPAYYAVIEAGERELRLQRYWQLDFTERDWSYRDAFDAFDAALHDAVRIRLMADVPVGAYLSGGLDSSVTTSLAKEYATDLQTFSIAFDNPAYDESAYQQLVAAHLGTQHHVLTCDREMLAAAVPEVVRHAEAPQLRAGPVSMFLLSQSVHQHGFKVVITGEGADEFLLGYDLFRETAVRRFMARDPHSAMRRRLTRHLYTYLPDRETLQRGLELTFQQRLDHPDARTFSHDLRWSKVASLQSYFTPDVRAQFTPDAFSRQLEAHLPEGYDQWGWAAQAQTLEIMTFMTPYLLAPQGDRVAMAHSVEGRFPFLDHRVIELVNSFPVSFKLRTLQQDKYILRQLAQPRLPATIAQRPKVPYRAPVQDIVRAKTVTYVDDLLSERALRETGLFVPQLAQRLLETVRTGARVSEMDEMALFGIITTQLWHQVFIEGRQPAARAAVVTGSTTRAPSILTHKEHPMRYHFDAAQETERLTSWTKEAILTTFKRDGAVVGVSGGVDSATVLYLLVRALGAGRVVALAMPDRDSSPESAVLARQMAADLGVELIELDITPPLAALGCYEQRDDAVRRAVPGYVPDQDKMKIVLPQDLLGGATLNVFSVVVIKPDGEEIRRRLRPAEFNEIVSASNLKQRVRMMSLYREAERRNYAVAGTAQKNEHELGFFVKYGDGGADLQPLHHLYKTQVYQIAECLGVPATIRQRQPTTDTYSAECTQEEFFYRLPFDVLDAIWESDERGHSAQEIASDLKLTVKQVENALFDIHRKKTTTEFLRTPPLALKPVETRAV
jgi:asparagine synthase (glutamine-hydrolysing)